MSSIASTIGYSTVSGQRQSAISLTLIAVSAVALLVYVSGSFLIAEVLGIKREAQALLIVPIAVAAAYYLVSRPARLFDPLICFSVAKLLTELALRRQWSYVFDGLVTLLALTVLACAPARTLEKGARLVVAVAGIFALMALLQWAMLIWTPWLADYALQVSDEGTLQNTIEHPIALLGLISGQDYSFFGVPLVRMQSFAKEPSLNVAYFMLPASLAFLLNSRASLLWGCILLMFCVLSLSGSIYLAFAFTALWWPVLRVSSFRFAMPYGMLMLMGGFLVMLAYVGLEPLVEGVAYLAQYGDFLSKSVSLSVRVTGVITIMSAAMSAPFGSTVISDVPGPWLVNCVLAAGWLGALLIVWFLKKLGAELEIFQAHSPVRSPRRLGALLLAGSLATVMAFNDYQMSNYAGLVLISFIYHTLRAKNQLSLQRARARRTA